MQFTNFNRTISDVLANESILDMQGTIEALSKYYYTNEESFDGIFVAPEYQNRFEDLVSESRQKLLNHCRIQNPTPKSQQKNENNSFS